MCGTLYENARENLRANQEWTQNKRTKTKKKKKKRNFFRLWYLTPLFNNISVVS
jgi:hypothetical protein